MDRIKILLIDDDEMLRIYFKDIFWIHNLEYKYELTVADNIKKAEEVINNPETCPNIIFLDLVMPIESGGRTIASPEAGLGLLKKIKSDPKLKNIKVIAFSGHNEKALMDKVKKLGAENYLIKGNNTPKDLVNFIEKIAEQK